MAAAVRDRVRRASSFTPEEVAVKLRGFGVSLADAHRIAGLPDPSAMGEFRDEDAHIAAGERLLKALGFETVKFSQKKRVKGVTPGVPDRFYVHRARQLTFWAEWKQPGGQQRPDQRAFQELVESVGQLYFLGTYDDLRAWLIARGILAEGR